jgi:uncharacterized protein (UPF0254 family)
MTEPIALHAAIRRAHAASAKALAAAASYYQQQYPDTLLVSETVEGLEMIHAVMERTERGIQSILDGRAPQSAIAIRPEASELRQRKLDLAEQMARIGTSPAVAARTLGYSEPRSLYRWLRAQGRGDLVDKIIKGKAA